MISIKSMGFWLIGIGIVGTVFSFLVDFIGIGDDGIQAAQILGIELGILLVLIGFWLLYFSRKQKFLFAKSVNINQLSLPNVSPFPWVLTGFIVVYFALFLGTVFLNSERQMVYFNRYIPNTSLIGSDLRVVLQYVEAWLSAGESPYASGYIAYPPLALVLFAPLLLFSFPTNFYIITLATIVSYFLIALILPFALSRGRDKLTVFLIFVIGLFSYGFQFEIERGQSNLIAFALCMLSIYLFHSYPSLRFFAYFFITLAIQLKIYPAIFILLMIDNWRDWKTNIVRFAGLGLSNFALLFILGPGLFQGFLTSMTSQQSQLATWNGVSIRSFVFVLSRTGYNFFPEYVVLASRQHAQWFELFFWALFFLCLLTLIALAFIRREKGFNPFLFLACTVGALIIPTISNDYKLPLLIAPMSVLFANWPVMDARWKKVASITVLLLISIGFWSTFYPFKYKPEILHNTMPVLLFILLLVTFINLIAPRRKAEQPVGSSSI